MNVDGALKVAYGDMPATAIGIEAHGVQAASANVSGAVYVTATGGDALGLSVSGNHASRGYVGGNLIVNASGYATGASVVGFGNASTGGVRLRAMTPCVPILRAWLGRRSRCHRDDRAQRQGAHIYGNLTVISQDGAATGIELTSSGNTVLSGDFATVGGPT